MSAPRRVIFVLSVLCFVIFGFVGGCVLIIDQFEESYGGPCGRDFSASPRPVIPGSFLGAYEKRNLALLDRFESTFGSPLGVERRMSYQCHDNFGQGAVVGITSQVSYQSPADTARCTTVRQIESILAADGWTFQSLETADPNGPGYVGVTTAWKGTALLTASVQPDENRLFVTVDHAGSTVPTTVAPSIECR